MGALGRNRTFVVFDQSAKLKLPSDLAGVTAATYEPHASGNLQGSLGAAATRIEDQITKLGVRDAERLKGLSDAARGFDEAATQMEKLVELIARSRKVELEIISSQFGAMIAPDKLKMMKQDLVDLQETLTRTTPGAK